jgi:hypothetical protein
MDNASEAMHNVMKGDGSHVGVVQDAYSDDTTAEALAWCFWVFLIFGIVSY